MYKEDTGKNKKMLDEQKYVTNSFSVMSVYLAETLQNLCWLITRLVLEKLKS